MKVDPINNVTKAYLLLNDKKRQDLTARTKYKRKGQDKINFDDVFKKKGEGCS